MGSARRDRENFQQNAKAQLILIVQSQSLEQPRRHRSLEFASRFSEAGVDDNAAPSANVLAITIA
jgi:hypothetical protein